MVSPLLSRPGAVAGDGVDAGVAAHYGDPLREQRGDVLVVDRSHRDVIRIGGPDRLSWLHSLATQHLTALPPGEWTQARVLSPHGHVEHHLTLCDDGSCVTAHREPGTAGALLAFLDSMRFLLRVSPEVAHDLAVLTVGGVDRFVPRAGLAEAFDAAVAEGAVPAGMQAYEALRVASLVPRLGFETDHRTIPHEVGWLETAVHLEKGCYRGQEPVARVHNLGRPPRRLVLLHLDGVDRLPAHGDPVTWEDAAVGFVGTAARNHERGPIATALVKRNTPDDAPLLTAGIAAKVALEPA